MTNREKLKRKVIEAIHGLPYDEAVKKELGFGCVLVCKRSNSRAVFTHIGYSRDYNEDFGNNILYVENVLKEKYKHGHIWKNIKPNSCKDHYGNDLECKNGRCSDYWELCPDEYEIIGLPITIGRVMQALRNAYFKLNYVDSTDDVVRKQLDIESELGQLHYKWKLTKENGEEADDDYQSDETINALLELFK